MTSDQIKALCREQPLIASVQPFDPSSPTADPMVLLRLAEASVKEGVKIVRLEGIESIKLIKERLGVPIIGLIKKHYPGSEVYITPTRDEVCELLLAGTDVISLDGSGRERPGGVTFAELVRAVHEGGALVMADCCCAESAAASIREGADFVNTTLAGYTNCRPRTVGPDFEAVREVCAIAGDVPVYAEGRFTEPREVQIALRIGASAVVIGGAINDPIKQTRAFSSAAVSPEAVGAVDIGGTWIRFGVVSRELEVSHFESAELPGTQKERLDWIEARCRLFGITKLGVSSGGVIDPKTSKVTEAKPIIPEHVGTEFKFEGIEVTALNDGLASAWGHACLPDYADKRVAVLALGTGVGAGLADRGRLMIGSGGDYPRINDLEWGDDSFESLLGVAALSQSPNREQMDRAMEAAERAVSVIKALWMPDKVILCGGVGLADWMTVPGTEKSPMGPHAGLIGAACLALFPPAGLRG